MVSSLVLVIVNSYVFIKTGEFPVFYTYAAIRQKKETVCLFVEDPVC